MLSVGKLNWLYIALISKYLLLPDISLAQTPVLKTKPILNEPKIGVVLSGGGALGLAHIGVLKVLEERGIRPDYIVGTSMGSVVGGLYALGYTADEIKEIATSMDWESILSSYIPLSYVAFEEKDDYAKYPLVFPVKNGKLTLPTGLIEGQFILERFTELTWSAINYETFNDFPIPYRCVATDVSTGKEKIFDRGNLALAMRSSMAIPTVFTAMDVDSTLLVDGGALNNYPVDIAISMGANYIIGSDVTTGIRHAYEIDNMGRILYQIAMTPSLLKQKENIEQTNVYIHPDVSNYNPSDFLKSDSIIQTGVIAAQKSITQLDSLIETIGYQRQKTSPLPPSPTQHIELKKINYTIHNANHQLEQVKHEEVDKEFIINDFREDVQLYYGSLKYKSIAYWATPDTNNPLQYNLNIEMNEKPKTNMKVGVHFDNVYSIGLVTNFTMRDFVIPRSRTKLKLDISPNFKGEIQFLKYLGKKDGFNFVAHYRYFSLSTPVFENGDLDEISQSNLQFATAKFQTSKRLNSKFALGYLYHHNDGFSKLGNDYFKDIRFKLTFHVTFAEFIVNKLNRSYHPNKGSIFHIRADVVASGKYSSKYPKNKHYVEIPIFDSSGPDTILISQNDMNLLLDEIFTPKKPYFNLLAKYKQFISVSKKVKLILDGSVMATFQNQTSSEIFRSYNVGGYIRLNYMDIPFYGMNYAEIQTPNLAIARLDVQISPFKNFYTYLGANYGTFNYNIELGSNDITGPESSALGYGINIAYLTPIGPLEIGASINNLDKSVRWNFQLGFQF